MSEYGRLKKPTATSNPQRRNYATERMMGENSAITGEKGDTDVAIGESIDDDCGNETAVDMDNEDGSDEEEESSYMDPPSGFIRVRPSKFANIPSTIFIEYPPELGIRRSDRSILEANAHRKLAFTSYWERICVRNAFFRAGFVKSDTCWTAMWAKHLTDEELRELNCLQKVNHFPNSWCVGRKDRLLRTINSMKRLHGTHFDFHPDGYILPGEREAFRRQAKTDVESGRKRACCGQASTGSAGDDSPLWIVKPVASSCGRGIRVMSSLQALCNIPKSRKVIVQRYLDEPYLINGHKFDLRVYVLVTSVDPLRVYIHDEGLTRLATSKYSTSSTANKFAHLTNYSVNKKSKKFVAAAVTDTGESEEGEEAFKWSLKSFKLWLAKKESPQIADTVFGKIHDLCLKAMIAAESEITPSLHASVNFRTNCFELFGCDVILTNALEPILLEVNISPSLMGSSPLDKLIKGTLVADILHLVGLYPHDPTLIKQFESGRPAKPSASVLGSPGLPSGNSKMNGPNPFAFGCVSKMLNSQEAWRRNPSPASVDMTSLAYEESMWLLLLLSEDEFERATATRFHRVHPVAAKANHYCSIMRIARFSDHLLVRWVQSGGSEGEFRKLIPAMFFTKAPAPATSDLEAETDIEGTELNRGGSAAGVAEERGTRSPSVSSRKPIDSEPRTVSRGRSLGRGEKKGGGVRGQSQDSRAATISVPQPKKGAMHARQLPLSPNARAAHIQQRRAQRIDTEVRQQREKRNLSIVRQIVIVTRSTDEETKADSSGDGRALAGGDIHPIASPAIKDSPGGQQSLDLRMTGLAIVGSMHDKLPTGGAGGLITSSYRTASPSPVRFDRLGNC